MAVTYTATINKNHTVGDQRIMDVSFVASGTYTGSGGDVITGAQVGLDVIDIFQPVLDTGAGAQTNGVGVLGWNSTAGKLQIFVQGTAGAGDTMVELSNGTTVTGLGFRALIWGVA